MRKVMVVLSLPRRSPGKFILYAKHIASCMSQNANFPSPTVAIATLLQHIDDLERAEVVAMTRAEGTASLRNARLRVVWDDLLQLRTYVETVAARFPLAEALEIVASSGMGAKNAAGPKSVVFNCKQGRVSGQVILTVRHPGPTSHFYWQYSNDGVVWIDLPDTNVARAVVDGLAPGARVHFRFATMTKNARSDWSDPIVLLVV